MKNIHDQTTKPRVLVTGAGGLVARGIRPQLEDGFKLRLTDLASSIDGSNDFIQADLLDFSQTDSLFDGVDAVIHLAIASCRDFDTSAPPPPDRLRPYHEGMLDINIKTTAHVFEAARRAGVKKVVFVSSLTVYFGNRFLPRYSESDPVNPQSLYACTKLFGENLGMVYAREHDISVICLRIGQPYPSYTPNDAMWRNSKRTRSTCVSMEDIGFAVRQALLAPVPFGIYNIVSASDNPRFDITAAREIGYFPRAYFSDAGLQFFEDGNVPEFDGVICTQ